MTDQELQMQAEKIFDGWPKEKRSLFKHYLLKYCWWIENPTEEATKNFRAFQRCEPIAAYSDEFYESLMQLLNLFE